MSEGGLNIAQQKTLPGAEWRQIHDALRVIRQALPEDRESIYIQRREQLPENLRERFDSEYHTVFRESYEGEFNESSVNESGESGDPDEAIIEQKIERLQAQRTELQQLRDKAKEDLIVRFGNRGERVPGTKGFAWYEASNDSMHVVRGDGVIQEISVGDSNNFGNRDNPNWKKWLGRSAGGWVGSSEDEIRIAKRKAWEQRQSMPPRDMEQQTSSQLTDSFLEKRSDESDEEFLARLEKRLADEEAASQSKDPILGTDVQKLELSPEKINFGIKMRRRKSDGAWMVDEKGTGDYQLAVAGREYIGKKNGKDIKFTFRDDLKRWDVLGEGGREETKPKPAADAFGEAFTKKMDAILDSLKKRVGGHGGERGREGERRARRLENTWKRRIRIIVNDDNEDFQILEGGAWVPLEDEKRYKVEKNGVRGTAAWEADFHDFKDFKPDEEPVAATPPAEKTLEDDLGEMFGRESERIKKSILTARTQGFSEKVIFATIQGGLKKEGVTAQKYVQSLVNVAKAIIQNERPTDIAINNTLELLRRDTDVLSLMRDLSEIINTWRAEEDEAFVEEILRSPPAGVDMTLAPRVLLSILATPTRSEQEIGAELQNRLGAAAQVFARRLYAYTHGKGAGTREAELLERAEFFGMTDAEVEAIIARERGR